MFKRRLRALNKTNFVARSAERDLDTDQSRISDIDASIAGALRSAEAEYGGLSSRLEEVLARASVTVGNETDEYLTRESLDSHHQDLLGKEIKNAQRRLQELSTSIGHFRFLKVALRTRFPNYDGQQKLVS